MSVAQIVTRSCHWFGLPTIASLILGASVAVAASNEHWVCGIPTLVDPAHVNLSILTL
jgi:hypothetical protein